MFHYGLTVNGSGKKGLTTTETYVTVKWYEHCVLFNTTKVRTLTM
jgi:hypothetical protein